MLHNHGKLFLTSCFDSLQKVPVYQAIMAVTYDSIVSLYGRDIAALISLLFRVNFDKIQLI